MNSGIPFLHIRSVATRLSEGAAADGHMKRWSTRRKKMPKIQKNRVIHDKRAYKKD